MDFGLSLLRLVACYLLSVQNRIAWLLILVTNFLKILILNQIGLPLLATSKFFTSSLSLLAWILWRKKTYILSEKAHHTLGLFGTFFLLTLSCLGALEIADKRCIDQQLLIVMCNLTGYLLAIFKHRLCWFAWTLYDVLLVNMFLNIGMPLSALVTLMYIPIAILGAQRWQLSRPSFAT